MKIADQIAERLQAALAPELLEVVDDSERHRGHAGYPEGGQSHFNVRIKAAALDELSRLERHRAVHAAIGPELIGRIHALSLEIV